tara:strand:+ start:227 stop:1114 length:888 start_codon:yes stop_codon:yes gene_type:complete
MDKKTIVRDFTKNNLSTRDISKKYEISINHVKDTLKNNIGKEEYLVLAHRLGAKRANEKLKNPTYKSYISKKISKSVSSTIQDKMKNPKFREEWINKSKKASKKGKEKINLLLENDQKFRENWSKNAKQGGLKTFSLGLGAFDKSNAEARKIGALKGLRNTKRKALGPRNERMYNDFETYIAKLILDNNLDYKYERIFNDKNYNGFISCDFEIKLNNKTLLVESTCWDKFKEKSLQINKKFEKLKYHLKDFEYILVSPTKRQSERYSEFLNPEIKCFSSYKFKEVLKNFYSGRRI